MVNYKLLSLAIAIINANKQFNAALSGSLMLALRGIDLNRDQHDIDIAIDKKVDSVYNSICLPREYTRRSSKYPVVTSFYANRQPSIDIFYSLEKREIIHGIPCTTIEQVLKAKRIIANNSLIHSDARTKHENDIKIIEESIINPPPMFYPSISDLISSEGYDIVTLKEIEIEAQRYLYSFDDMYLVDNTKKQYKVPANLNEKRKL